MTLPNDGVKPDALPIGDRPLRNELKERLLCLNFHAFAECIRHLLERMGYEDVRLSGRRDWRGRNAGGGYDLEAFLPCGIGRRRVIVQVKQYDSQLIFQRSLDELRGATLRSGASEALLITTGRFAPSVGVLSGAWSLPSVAPVRLLDGEALFDLMATHLIGVFEEPGGTADEPTVLGIDEAYFGDLNDSHPGNGPSDYDKEHAKPNFLVTVEVRPLAKTKASKAPQARTARLLLK